MSEELMMTITGEEVKAERERRKLSRAKFAALVGLTPAKIHNIENGREPRPEEAEKLRAVMDGAQPDAQLPLGNGAPTDDAPSQPQAQPSGSTKAWSTLDAGGNTIVFEVLHANGWHSRCPVCMFQFSRTGEQPLLEWMVQHIPTCTGDAVVEQMAQALDPEVSAPAEASSSDTFAPVVDAPPGHEVITVSDDELEDEEPVIIEAFAPVVALPVGQKPDPSTGRLFSNSELQTFKRCRRRWWFGWYRALRLRVVDVTGPRSIGTRVHAALAAWYVPDGEPRTDPREALERVIVEDWTNLMQSLNGLPPDDTTVSKFQREADLCRAMVEGYVQWLGETGADEDITVIAPETYLEATLPIEHEVPVKIIGKLDVRARRKHDNAKLLVDHKTVGDLTTPMKTIAMNEQMLQYHLLELLNGGEEERSDGALYNMLRKVKRTANAKPPFYERVEVRHNPHEIEAFMKRLSGEIMDVISVQRALDDGGDPLTIVYPTINDTCSWQCDFYPICPMVDDGSRLEDAIENLYVQGDPLAYYGAQTEVDA